MGHGGEFKDVAPGKFTASTGLKTMYSAFIFIGVITFVMGLIDNQPRLWTAYLTGFMYFTAITVGALFFLAINHVSNAGWSVNIRRFAEGMVSFTPVMIIGSVTLIFAIQHLYPWARPEVMANDALVQVKEPYSNPTGFFIRMVIFGFGMWFFGHMMVSKSVAQDATGDEKLTKSMVPYGIGFLAFFAISYSLFAVDTLMALLPHWYSTIFGLYVFAGGFQAALAVLCLIAIYMINKGLVRGITNVEHVHDIAKYMKAFTVFWAYIAFSQYLLIWYTNIPEETEFFHMRSHGEWMFVSLSLLVFKFAVPFLALLPRGAKRNFNHLIAVSILILVMHYVDLYWLVYPNFNNNEIVFSFYEIGMFLGFAGLFMFLGARFFSKNNLVPTKDPRRHESYAHHVTY